MSSSTALRNTTLPSESTIFSPILNADLSTIEGMPPLFMMSEIMLRSPSTTLLPPVSSARLSAVGLRIVFDGDSASVISPVTKRA